MPIYEYKCDICSYRVVLDEIYSAERTKCCPECKGRDSLHRQISKNTFHLKGNNWTGKRKYKKGDL